MSDDKISMPATSGGLVRYFDDFQSKIEIKPSIIIAIIVLITIVEMFLHYRG